LVPVRQAKKGGAIDVVAGLVLAERRIRGISPGDCVVAAPHWPKGKDDVEALREAVRRIVEPGMRPAVRVALVNIVALG
jgi:hypothetical protein